MACAIIFDRALSAAVCSVCEIASRSISARTEFRYFGGERAKLRQDREVQINSASGYFKQNWAGKILWAPSSLTGASSVPRLTLEIWRREGLVLRFRTACGEAASSLKLRELRNAQRHRVVAETSSDPFASPFSSHSFFFFFFLNTRFIMTGPKMESPVSTRRLADVTESLESPASPIETQNRLQL